MNERQRGRRSWGDTLSELGLEGETASQPAAPASPPPPPAPPIEPPRSREPSPVPAAPPEEEAPPPRHRRGRRELPPVEDTPEPIESAPEEVAAESVETAPGEESPADEEGADKGGPRKRRRRRGRRGGRGDKVEEGSETPDDVAPVEGEAVLTESISTQEVIEKSPAVREANDRGDRSRRPRRRRPGEDVAIPAARKVEEEADPEEVEVIAREPAADEEEPVEDMSAWNVPSWQEIIASLYRPER